jgi:hypothetical protein
MSALTIKIPEPIIEPMTIMVEESSPSSRLNSAFESFIARLSVNVSPETKTPAKVISAGVRVS